MVESHFLFNDIGVIRLPETANVLLRKKARETSEMKQKSSPLLYFPQAFKNAANK